MLFKKYKDHKRINEIFKAYTPEQIVRERNGDLLREVRGILHRSSFKNLLDKMHVETYKKDLEWMEKIQKPIFEIADRVREGCICALEWTGDNGFGRSVEGFRLVDTEYDIEVVLYKLYTPWGPSYKFKNIKGSASEAHFLWRICGAKVSEDKEKPLIEKREELTRIYCGE